MARRLRPRLLPTALLTLAAAWAPLVVSCADDAQFTTRFIPDYPTSPHASVSVFGVYKDGRMSSEAWDLVAAQLLATADAAVPVPEPTPELADASALSGGGGSECAAAYSTSLVTKDMSLFTAVDEYARANGVTEGLLEKFAPSAKGDLIMVVTISGHVPAPDAGDTPAMQSSQPPMGGSGRGGMVGRQGMRGATSGMRRVENRDALEMSATLYSKSLKRTVGLVGMSYTGKSADEGLKTFAARLRSALPASPCAGWGELKVDEAAIHAIQE
jgi:hypothetical protein